MLCTKFSIDNKAQPIKGKIDNWTLSELSICYVQNPVRRNKRHTTKGEKIFANHISVKGLYPQYMKNSIVKPKPVHFANG